MNHGRGWAKKFSGGAAGPGAVSAPYSFAALGANARERAGQQLERDLPGYNDGYRDGLSADAESTFKEVIEARAEIERGDVLKDLSAQREDLTVLLSDVCARESVAIADTAGIQTATLSRAGCAAAGLVGLTVIVGEASLLVRVAEFTGITDPMGQWGFAIAATAGFALFLELLGRRYSRWYPTILVVSLCVALPTMAIMRAADLQALADEEGNWWQRLVVEQPWVTGLFLLSFSLMLAIGAAVTLGTILRSLDVHARHDKLRRVQREKLALDRRLAAVTTAVAQANSRIEAVVRVKQAECLAGIRARRSAEATAAASLEKAATTPIPSRSSVITSAARGTWWPAVGRVGLVVALLSVALYLSVGCERARPKPRVQMTAIVIDQSTSVSLTEADTLRVIAAMLSRAPRCSTTLFQPAAGDAYPVDVPCTRTPYDADLHRLYTKATRELMERFADWRTKGESDYQGALRLSNEWLHGSTGSRALVIMGDLEDASGRRAVRRKSSGLIAGLADLQLSGIDVYLGFPGLRAGTDESMQAVAAAWTAELGKHGADPGRVTVRTYGLSSLDSWADATIGPRTKAYEKWERSGSRKLRGSAPELASSESAR
jgi:hypothetical protein